MVAGLLTAASAVAPIAGKLTGGADKSSAMLSSADARSSSGGNEIGLSTGSFNVGGTQTTNTIFIVAGVIALVFLLMKFFKK